MIDLYFCPTVGEIESTEHGGFKDGICCAHPERHVPVEDSPAIEAISQYLSDKAREEYAAPPVHPGQSDPTLIKWVSDADEAKAELLRLQKVSRYYRDHHPAQERLRLAATALARTGYFTAEEIGDDIAPRVTELVTHMTQTSGACPGYETEPSTCRCGCEGCQHNCAAHQEAEPLTSKALEHVTEAIARHDLDKTVGADYPLPGPDHKFWPLWRATARVAVDAYFVYMERTGHVYLSTSCKHGEHGYCQSNTGSQGQKIPAQCKFCASPCVCSCHFLGAAPVKTSEITS